MVGLDRREEMSEEKMEKKTPEQWIRENYLAAIGPDMIPYEETEKQKEVLRGLRVQRKDERRENLVREKIAKREKRSPQKMTPTSRVIPQWLLDGKNGVFQFDIVGRKGKTTGHMTVVFMPAEKKGTYQKGFLMGVSYCSPTDLDKYSARSGEGIAKTKARQRGLIPLNLVKICEAAPHFYDVFTVLLEERDPPTWAKREVGGFTLIPRGPGTISRMGWSL